MSLTHDRSTLSRLNKEIADLRIKEAGEVKKAAEVQKKINSALDSARRASSASSAKSYLSTADRETKNLESAQNNQSRYSSQAASKALDVARLQEKIVKEEENERKKYASADEKRRRDDEARRKAGDQRQRRVDEAAASAVRAMEQKIGELEVQLAAQLEAKASATPAFKPLPPEGEPEAYDVFISHAWEDKKDFVQDLASRARDSGLRVWYDNFALEWGDSLRQKIDAGLSSSYFGVAVLSPSFLLNNGRSTSWMD